ncbi:MAG: dUTP diphosphatase [Myxococcota bacterium]|nr:dUTP diphosphatase [Myxococcota bacterium]
MSEPVTVEISRLRDHTDSGSVELPRYMSPGAVGMDVRAALDQELTLPPGGRAAVPTALAAAVPPGWEIQVRPRSGLAIKHGITVVNAPGTIDPDYRGEIRILLVNLGDHRYTIRHGDRIAQLILCPVGRVAWRERDSLENTDRGDGGFGSTGVR